LSQRAWWLLVATSVFFALDLWFWHRSINLIGPGLSTLLANFQVFFMMIAGIVFLRQMPRPVQVIAVPLALLGLALIVGLDWSALPAFRAPTREMAVVSVMCAVMMAATVLVEGESLSIPSYEDLGWLVAYGVLSHCIGWLFIASSLPEVTTVEAGLALLLQPTLSFVWDVAFFDRPMTATELAGAGIVLMAIYLGSRPSSKQIQGAR